MPLQKGNDKVFCLILGVFCLCVFCGFFFSCVKQLLSEEISAFFSANGSAWVWWQQLQNLKKTIFACLG